MRRWIQLLAGVVALLVVTGCAAQSGQAVTSRKGTVQSMQKSSVQTENASPDREQVRNAYDHAITAIEWFRAGAMPCSGAVVSIKGGFYKQVLYAGITSMEDLKNYLRGLFSEELVEGLLAKRADGEHPRFLEANGALYELQEDPGGSSPVGEAQISIKKKSTGQFEVDVQTQLLAADGKTVTGVKYNAYCYERQDERWVFTNFDFPN